ncbi:uncharacterized protein METZ01_LOCUS199233, partial [marine metagenome]
MLKRPAQQPVQDVHPKQAVAWSILFRVLEDSRELFLHISRCGVIGRKLQG